ncbi:MAG: PQQ-dependent sugar dehydrogenase [Chitinophagaceae bacterium]|jgi:trimeric autotransporter adhesin|nr:PQQ-dependent sugar dehydrogenase [Chitinophagaceae bacterium]
MKQLIVLFTILLCNQLHAQTPPPSRMKEVFSATVLNSANINSGWEITFLPGDDSLWITEDTSYRILKMHPTTGGFRSLVDLSDNATVAQLNGISTAFRRTFPSNVSGWPQGGMMGLAIHPEFVTNAAKKFIYLAYVHSRTSSTVYTSRLVRFTFNTTTGFLEDPRILCDTLPGSNDHNSGRIIIAPEGGTDYLFYALGDMGAGQFGNTGRAIKSQLTNSYEGKMLRFNLEEDADADQGAVDYNKWIPNDNPYNNVAPVTGQSAVYSIGHRNVQGLVYANGKLYGSSHGQFSDDEVNILEREKNYGHPRIQGYADGNYNNAHASLSHTPYTVPTSSNPTPTQTGTPTTMPFITDEAADALTIPNYVDPIYSLFAAPNAPLASPPAAPPTGTNSTYSGSIRNIYAYNPGNMTWPSIAPSGMDAYTHSKIPGWKNSLILASLKQGSMMRLKLNADGSDVINGGIGGFDTSYIFPTNNRYRDLAIDPDGWSIYASIDRRGSTSGPSTDNPVSSTNPGAIIKYTFKGYNSQGTSPVTSAMPDEIAIDSATTNTCINGTTVVISAANNNNTIWVPVTGPNGDIIAEINANGNDLGTVTTSSYIKTGATRTFSGQYYMNRSITINRSTTGTISAVTPVRVKLYFTRGEFNNLVAADPAITGILDLAILKNNNACGTTMVSGTITRPTVTGRFARGASATYGYALQTDITGFSTFYFANANSTLPVDILKFTATAKNEHSLLQWNVTNETGIQSYIIERSTDQLNFVAAGKTNANNAGDHSYSFTDFNAGKLSQTVYYRLKVLHADGTEKYTQVASVKFGRRTNGILQLFPNPVHSYTSIGINALADETVQMRIADNTGRVVMTRNFTVTKGMNNFNLDLSSLPAGFYFVDVTGAHLNEKTKFIKQ